MNQYQLSPVDLPKNDNSCVCGENYSDGSCCGWKPKTKFCWHCGRMLRANFFREYKNPDDGHTYTVHAQCYGQLTTGCPPVRSEDEEETIAF